MAENDWDLAKIPLQNFWSANDLKTVDQSKRTPVTLGQKFDAGASAGAYGLEANINYLDAAFQAITGDQEELDESLDRARLSQEIASEYMEDLTPFDEFWEEPTVDGFLEQAAIGLGQFFPSGLASIAAATTGAAVGLVAGPTTAAGVGLTAAAGVVLKQGLSKGSMKLAKNILRESLEKRAKKVQMSKDDFTMAEASHALTKMQRFKGPMGAGRNVKFGALAGAGTQEYTQGAGITFGEFADQDMTGAREAAISFGVGVPYAAVGLGAEFVAAKAVLTPLLKEATKKAARRGPQSSGYKKLVSELGPLLKAGGKGVAVGGTVGALSEGGAEVVQETMTGIQKLAIDPDYTPAELKMNLIEAAFKGAIGGAGMSGAGRGVTQMARELIDTTQNRFMEQGDLFGADEQINKKLSDALKIKDVIARRQKAQESIVIKGTTATTKPQTTQTKEEKLIEIEAELQELDNLKNPDDVADLLDINSPEYRALDYRIEALKRLRGYIRSPKLEDKNKVLSGTGIAEFIEAFIEEAKLMDEASRRNRSKNPLTESEKETLKQRYAEFL